MTAYRLVLWAVDHTLIASGGVGGEISRAAFLRVTGVRQVHDPDVAGRAERAILAESCRLHGLDPDSYAFENYAAALACAHASDAPFTAAGPHGARRPHPRRGRPRT